MVDNCTIDGFSVAGISATTSATVKFFVTNTTITNAATGINLSPTAFLSGQVDHTSIRDMSTAGINATGPVNIAVSNSVISNTATGAMAASSSTLGVDSSQINNNGTAFASSNGSIRVSRNILYDNNFNFSISGGTIASAGNNILAVNGATVPNGTVSQQ